MRLTQVIIGNKGLREITDALSREGKIIYSFDGKEVGVDDVREIENNSKVAVIINNADRLNRSAAAALLKDVEEGETTFIFFVNSILLFNPALASRCQKVFLSGEDIQTKEDLWGDLDNKEKDIVNTIIGRGNITRIDVYEEHLDYKKIFTGIAKAYANKHLFDDVSHDIWNRIESIIFESDFQANRRALWYLMK